MEEYRIRSKEGIERLVNLISLSYSAMTLLPYSDETFSEYQSASAQETRYEIGQQIQASIYVPARGGCDCRPGGQNTIHLRYLRKNPRILIFAADFRAYS